MAATTSWKPVSAEELQKANDDLDELLARSPIADDAPGKKRKKKTYRLPPDQVPAILNYKFDAIRETPAINKLAEEDPEKYGELKTIASILNVFTRHAQDKIRAKLEAMRRQFQTQGYMTYEATDDEAEDDPRPPRGGRGRRRHRPGVAKRAGGEIKKLN